MVIALVFLITLCLGGSSMRVATFILLNLLIFCCQTKDVQAETLYIVAHKHSFITSKDTQNIADFYLIKRTISSSGNKVIPINLPSGDPLRGHFSQAIFNRSPRALGEYWDRMSFRGIKPPVVQNTEQAVLLFVSRIPGAIGYISHKPNEQSDVIILKEIEI